MNDAPRPLLFRWIKIAAAIEDGVLAGILIMMIGLAAVQILLRNLLHTGLLWADPALRVMVLWIGLIGAMVATRHDKQITVDVLSRFLAPRAKAGLRVATDVFTALVSAVVAWHGGRLVLEDRAAGSEVFASVPVWVCELVIPLAFAVIAARYLLYAIHHVRQVAESEGGK
jgi:TRAP-type C4-dicarboxylate transport system permease small subunit